jgi:chromosome partitioning protein
MHTIIVANPKGGTGKTTLATNIAGWLAAKKQRVVLADFDTQRSSADWLKRRPELLPKIVGWTPDQDKKVLQDAEPQWLVIDLPAGIHGDTLRDAVRRAEVLLVPVSPSAFDMDATKSFLAKLAEYKAVKDGAIHIGLVGMRVDSRTRSATELEEFLNGARRPHRVRHATLARRAGLGAVADADALDRAQDFEVARHHRFSAGIPHAPNRLSRMRRARRGRPASRLRARVDRAWQARRRCGRRGA